MQRQRISPPLLTVFLALAGLAPEAQAYLDPSTGSMILSAIVGLFATIGLTLKTYWYKIRNLLLRRSPDRNPSGSAPDAGQHPGAESRPVESHPGERPS